MPRKKDPLLERKLVQAAHVLCARQDIQAVTMRQVARLAQTSTPTVYQRFAEREALLHALCEHIRNRLARELGRALSPEDAWLGYLKFAVRNRHEYGLLMNGVGRTKTSGSQKKTRFRSSAKKAGPGIRGNACGL